MDGGGHLRTTLYLHATLALKSLLKTCVAICELNKGKEMCILVRSQS